VTAVILHKYIDLGPRAFCNITLPSGERVFVSVQPKGITVHRLHLRGHIPGRRLFGAGTDDGERMVRVMLRDESRLPPLPTATERHRDDGAMMEFIDAAIVDLKALGDGKAIPGAVDAIDTDNPPPRPLALLTRLALTCATAAALAERLEGTRNTAG